MVESVEGAKHSSAPKSKEKLDAEIREIAYDLEIERILSDTQLTRKKGREGVLEHHRKSIVGRETPTTK